MSSSGTVILIFVLLLLCVILSQREARLMAAVSRKRRTARSENKNGGRFMTNELIQKYIGKNCMISRGTFGDSVTGTITSVVDNWIEVVTKKENLLINADFITCIKEIPAK